MHSLTTLFVLAVYAQSASAVFHAARFDKALLTDANFDDNVWPGPNSGLDTVPGLKALKEKKKDKIDKKSRKIHGTNMATVRDIHVCNFACTECKTMWKGNNQQTPSGVAITEAYYCGMCKFEPISESYKVPFTLPSKKKERSTYKPVKYRDDINRQNTIPSLGGDIGTCWYPEMTLNFGQTGDMFIVKEWPDVGHGAANGMKIVFNVDGYYENTWWTRDQFEKASAAYKRKNEAKAKLKALKGGVSDVMSTVGGWLPNRGSSSRSSGNLSRSGSQNDLHEKSNLGGNLSESSSSIGEKKEKEKEKDDI